MPPREHGWGPSLRCVELPTRESMIILDVVDEQIALVEILDRPGTGDRLREICP